ncbi:MAG TPA: hypothetical protein VGM50_17230 [Gemmatimonadaceae bacterium]|jgi:hypothetical protein
MSETLGPVAPHATATDAVSSDDRRAFLGKLAMSAGSLALGGAALSLSLPNALRAETPFTGQPVAPDPKNWLTNLKGKHRQLVDAFSPNEGYPLAFAYTFLLPQTAAEPGGAVVVLRHMAMPLALNSNLWAKYKIGENLKVDDPLTKKPATRNPFYKAPAGSLLADDMAIDKLMAKGVIFGACNVALNVLSGMFAPSAGVTKEVAAKEWMAGVLPGITVIPSGTWGVNRAQEAGCTYCTGG